MEIYSSEPFHRGIDRRCALRPDPLLGLATLTALRALTNHGMPALPQLRKKTRRSEPQLLLRAKIEGSAGIGIENMRADVADFL
jgi:hypothetical protein